MQDALGEERRQPRRVHYYLTPEAECALSTLRAVLPGASASRLVRLGLAALVDRLQPQDVTELEAELTGRAE